MSDKDLVTPILVSSNENYFVFSAQEILPFGKFFAETLEDLFEISTEEGKVIFEVAEEEGLPAVKVTCSLRYRGKQNYQEGELSQKTASYGMTFFLQRHLAHLLSNSPGFTNENLLNRLIQTSSALKNGVNNHFDDSEILSLYRFWD